LKTQPEYLRVDVRQKEAKWGKSLKEVCEPEERRGNLQHVNGYSWRY
jgi:hypothetical protein